MNKRIPIQGMDILVVDDNPKNLQVVGNILKDYKFNLRFALNGLKALSSIENKAPDLILLDINMPEMDGFEVCTRIKSDEKTAHIPVIFVTAAKKDDEHIIKGFKVGGVDYIIKPFNQEELVARITSQLHLKAFRDYLQTIIDEKNRIFSIFAHDIKNPFSGIMGVSQLSLNQSEKITKEKLLSNMKMINDAGNRVYKLLEDLTYWAGIQSDMLRFNPESIHLGETFQKITELFLEAATAKNIEISYPQNDINVFADRLMFETILRNIINNALKFTESNGKIEISIEAQSEFTKINIKDSGIGMSKTVVDKLLHNTVNSTTYGTSGEKGTGLGVGICKEMVRKNGGEFFVESVLNEGTIISFTIPNDNNKG